MAAYKCKMCGGDLLIEAGVSVCECEYCGTKQTVPNADNEKKLVQLSRAAKLLRECDFDRAAALFENVVVEFPEEAEAYWNLVLCRFGIEYVDDPATTKKVPTCHRSSFDSVMDDENFEKAMDYADAVARRVYREEAKAIEELRKSIIEVSGKEEPYDVFISYKETGDDGQRTMDSVIAQDIYDALTNKGYRVFFSRISLEDKLGTEYEPYIFAALNSAKVMLVVGTDYEHYNAVWVKNEWSRYLKIIAQDKSKYLIPCYKSIDAYDMPKEFAHLQGQDMGKVGAIQDLLRGVEKILPKQMPVTVVQERVLVGGSGNNKIASLLDRGNMALEDGDWAKADSFFEDVLNNDSKNAQAYLGKTLALEKCRTIDAFARKRKDASQSVRGEKLALRPNCAHVDEMVERFSLPGYVAQNTIRKLYDFDLSYHSDVAERKQQYRSEENYWANHKQLSKAEKFAVGAVAENLEREKKTLFATLSDRVKRAEVAEAAVKKDVQARYEAHLRQADEQAEKLYNDGLSRREKQYQELLQIAKTSSSVEELTETAKKFDALGGYQDSKNLAEHCRKRAAEEQEKINSAAEAKRIADKKAAAARKKKNMIIGIIATVIVVVVVIVGVIATNSMKQSQKYESAISMMEEKDYEEAIAVFESLGEYKDSIQQIESCKIGILDEKYNNALTDLDNGSFLSAKTAFEELGDYKDSAEQVVACETAIKDQEYESAMNLFNKGDYDAAIEVFTAMEGYRDSVQQIEFAKDKKYELAQAMLDSGDTYGAYNAFLELNHKDSQEKATESLIQELINTFGNSNYDSLNYLTVNREVFPLLTGEQIKEVIANHWIEKSRYIGDYVIWDVTLSSNGVGTDNFKEQYMRSWKIVGDKLHYESHLKTSQIDINESFYAFEVRALAEGVYVLYDATTNRNTSNQAEILLVDSDSLWAERLEKYADAKKSQ